MTARSLTPTAWACLLGSGCCCGAYYLFLARAYVSSDFTVVYPPARALPVILVGIGDAARGREPSGVGWLGMALVVVGCTLAPLRSLRGFSFAAYWNRTNLWLLLTALGTFGYTMLDSLAAETVSRGPATAARYGYFFFLVSAIAYGLLSGATGKARESEQGVGWKGPALAAVCNFGAYWLVLWAYQMTSRAGYVVAFRQFSIVIGVAVAFVVFREEGKGIRLTATAAIAAGLILIGLWGATS